MLTILHTESSSGWGGQENRTLHECLGLKRTFGERVIVLCRPGSGLEKRARAAGLEVLTNGLRSSHDIAAVKFVAGLIKREGVDVVSTHSGVDSFLCAVAARLSRRRPVIVRTRHLALPITSKTTYSLLPHRVVTVSEYVRRHLVDGKGLKGGMVVTIPTGIDLERFNPDKTPHTFRQGAGFGQDDLIVGTVAILRRKKGHHLLLDAIPLVLKELPRVNFVFAGDGPQRENIEGKIKELGIEKSVTLLGLRADVECVLKGIDLFVLPTLQEALGTSILEASAMGRAVISTRVGGVPEVVVEGVTGQLVEPEDSGALADAIIKLLKDGALRRSMGEEGRRMVTKEFSTERMVERMHGLYAGLCNGRGRGRS